MTSRPVSAAPNPPDSPLSPGTPPPAPAYSPAPDPALHDRRRLPLPVIEEGELPIRSMTIAGLEGRMEARILSKDPSGPATRLARIPHGYGSGMAGAFTADLELFVVQGSLIMGGEAVGENDYAAVRAGQVVSGLRASSDSLALVMTSAPVRYDPSAGGALSPPLLGRAGAYRWEEVGQTPGRFVMPLADGLLGRAWLSGCKEWSNRAGPWHDHPSPEEVFVLDGSLTITEVPASADHPPPAFPPDPEQVETRRLRSGSYIYRPPGQLHAGPGSGSRSALAFHRLLGPGSVRWREASA